MKSTAESIMYHSSPRSLLLAVFITSITFSCSDKPTPLFTSLPASATNIDFENKLGDRDFFNIIYYLYYYNGGGVATGDINNDGLIDIYFTANSRGNNRLYLNKGDLKFEDITSSAGVAGTADWNSGVTMADVNGDGLLDIYVSTVSGSYDLKGRNELFINQGNGRFKEEAEKYGLNVGGLCTQAAFFDYDQDGDLDCYVLRHSKRPHANIVDTINRRKPDSLSGDLLFRNDLGANGPRYTDVSATAGIYQSNLGYGLGLAIGDINNDGWDDIYIGNDFHENDYFYLNNGNGSFTESGASYFNHYSRFSMGNDVADFNNDGLHDVVTVDMLPPDERTLKTYGSDENPDIYKVKLEIHGYQHQYSRNALQMNNGRGRSFSEIGLLSGIAATDWSWAPLFADLDRDGRKDLFISSGIVSRPVDLDYIRFVSDMDRKTGMNRDPEVDRKTIDQMPEGSSHPFLYRGSSRWEFEDMSEEWGTADLKGFHNGAAYADLDNDGDLDLVINSINAKATVLRNNSTGKNGLVINFLGNSHNRHGIGARVYVFTPMGMQYQQVSFTRGFQSSVDPRLFFGVDSLQVIDSLMVVWPGGASQVLKQLPVNKTIVLNQADAQEKFDFAAWNSRLDPSNSYFSNTDSLNWKHQENDFLDYNVQYLIPHAQSTRGPKFAVADVNGDGLEDIYACGARNQAGSLLIQTSAGTFIESKQPAFEENKSCEDVDALFFDANGDGYSDLFVVSGGNEVPQNASVLEDRLYLNDGKGNFTRKKDVFTYQYENKSCAAVADIDRDGDMDLFVGNLASATGYGIPKTSYLYINDGKAKFTLASTSVMNLREIGMVTDASFADLDGNGFPDLVVTGEWMPVRIFMNNAGEFTAKDIPASTGLWQTIQLADVNRDGKTDILAGNWGLNTKLYAGKQPPLKLYVKDFDNNGSTEQIMAYTIGEEEYTFLAKDELERALPVLKKAYLKYSEVAGKTVQYMFYDLFKDYRELKAETLASTCFFNQGNGNFNAVSLPPELQLSPIMCFADLGETGGFLAAGNFFGTIPYEGRYDAQLPTRFKYEAQQQRWVKLELIPGIRGEARDARWINGANGNRQLLLGMNNSSPYLLKPGNN